MTRIGRTYVFLTFGVGLGTLRTGNNMLYLVLGLLLSLIVVSGVLSERSLRRLRVRRLGAEGAFAGEPFAFRWSLEKRDGPAFALTVSELDAPVQGEAQLPVLEPGAPRVLRGDLLSPRRGVHRLSAIRVSTTYPLGLFVKSRVFEAEDLLVVYPRRRPGSGMPATRPAGPGDAGTPGRGAGAGDVYGLVEFREGDDARRIHWLKSAAANGLLRTERERDERRSAILHVNPAGAPERVDHDCEEAAAAAEGLFAQGFEVGLEAGATRLRPAAGPGQARRILQALAWVGSEEAR